MAVITVAQQKGGAGKTTLAANLAAAFAATHSVAVLDVDPQKSLTRWNALRLARSPAPPALTFSDPAGWRLASELERLRRDYDVVLVDSAPHVDSDARRAVRGADLVLVPVQPSPPDIWAAEGTLKLAEDEKRPACLVLNRMLTRTGGGQRLAGLVDAALLGHRARVLPNSLGNRTAFTLAFAQGLGITEAAPRTVAAAELRALADSILRIISA